MHMCKGKQITFNVPDGIWIRIVVARSFGGASFLRQRYECVTLTPKTEICVCAQTIIEVAILAREVLLRMLCVYTDKDWD